MRLCVLVAAALLLGTAEVQPRDTYLLLDPEVADVVRNADLMPGPLAKPITRGLVIEDHPIEEHADPIIPSVIYDLSTQLFRCWYSIWNVTRSGPQAIPRLAPALAYAESKDGIHWNRAGVSPWRIPAIGAGVLADDAGRDDNRRFKLFAGGFVSFSGTGYAWQDPEPAATGLMEHAPASLVHVPDEDVYFGFGALKEQGAFAIARTVSRDLLNWTPPEVVLRGNAEFHPRGMAVFRHAGLYLGLVAVEAVTSGKVHCEVAWSSAGRQWRWVRLGTPLFSIPGAAYCSVPVILRDEVRIYFGESDPVNNRGGQLGVATLAPDGFAGYRSRPEGHSVVVTKPLRLPGGPLRVLAAVEPGGAVRVDLLGSSEGVLASSQPITGAQGGRIAWADGAAPDTNQPVRVRFTFRLATVFGISEDSPATGVDDVYSLRSANQEYPVALRVLQPRTLAPGKRYPVIYLLPVNMGTAPLFGDGLQEAARLRLADRHDAIFVAPSFDRWPIAFPDHATNPHIRYESYILNELLPLIETRYPAIRAPEGRLLVGFSNSGWGAFSLMLRHPEVFGRAASWEGALLNADHLSHPRHLEVFGTDANYQTYTMSHLLRRRAEVLKGQRPRLILLGYSAEAGLENLEQIHRNMAELGIPHVYSATKRPAHRWDSGWLEEAVTLLLQ